MKQRHSGNGNGSGKFNIHTIDMGGWVRVYTDKLANVPDDLGRSFRRRSRTGSGHGPN